MNLAEAIETGASHIIVTPNGEIFIGGQFCAEERCAFCGSLVWCENEACDHCGAPTPTWRARLDVILAEWRDKSRGAW